MFVLLDWINLYLKSFGDLVVLLFKLPIYGDVTVGFFLVALAVFALFLGFMYRRLV